jgi:arabinose-5-phosphate isomerase
LELSDQGGATRNRCSAVEDQAGATKNDGQSLGQRAGHFPERGENDELLGIVTDGDLRRMLRDQKDFSTLQAKDIMNAKPKVVSSEEYAANALAIMQEKSITQLVVVEDKRLLGFVHLHDLLKEGLA